MQNSNQAISGTSQDDLVRFSAISFFSLMSTIALQNQNLKI